MLDNIDKVLNMIRLFINWLHKVLIHCQSFFNSESLGELKAFTSVTGEGSNILNTSKKRERGKKKVKKRK